jgi:SOS-response transcriptional repressor LexA
MTTLEKLRNYYSYNKCFPSYRELCPILGVRSKNAAYKQVTKLIINGYLSRSQNGRLSPTKKFFSLHLVDQPIPAGFSAPIEEAAIDTFSLEDYLITNPNSTIMVRVQGDSMEGVGIYEGDLVIVEKGVPTRPGHMVIAIIDGEFTLKFLRRKQGQLCLEAANPKYPDFYPEQNLEVFGKVVGVVRKVK